MSTKPLLSLAHDEAENHATSGLRTVATVGAMRAGLTAVEEWASRRTADACFVEGYSTGLANWLAYARHLLRKLPDESLTVEVPRSAEDALDEVASWALNLELATDLPTAPGIERRVLIAS